MAKFVSYLRRSTGKQPLSIETQRAAVAAMVGLSGEILAEYIETVSGRADSKPQLEMAIKHSLAARACLVCSRLDRIGRNAATVLTLLDDAKKAGMTVLFADQPNASPLSIGVLALVAQEEAQAISARTVASLAAAKARGVQLGGPLGAKPLNDYVREHGNGAATEGARRAADDFADQLSFAAQKIVADGVRTLAGIAAKLNDLGFPSRRGGRWHASNVSLLVKRLGLDIAA